MLGILLLSYTYKLLPCQSTALTAQPEVFDGLQAYHICYIRVLVLPRYRQPSCRRFDTVEMPPPPLIIRSDPDEDTIALSCLLRTTVLRKSQDPTEAWRELSKELFDERNTAAHGLEFLLTVTQDLAQETKQLWNDRTVPRISRVNRKEIKRKGTKSGSTARRAGPLAQPVPQTGYVEQHARNTHDIGFSGPSRPTQQAVSGDYRTRNAQTTEFSSSAQVPFQAGYTGDHLDDAQATGFSHPAEPILYPAYANGQVMSTQNTAVHQNFKQHDPTWYSPNELYVWQSGMGWQGTVACSINSGPYYTSNAGPHTAPVEHQGKPMMHQSQVPYGDPSYQHSVRAPSATNVPPLDDRRAQTAGQSLSQKAKGKLASAPTTLGIAGTVDGKAFGQGSVMMDIPVADRVSGSKRVNVAEGQSRNVQPLPKAKVALPIRDTKHSTKRDSAGHGAQQKKLPMPAKPVSVATKKLPLRNTQTHRASTSQNPIVEETADSQHNAQGRQSASASVALHIPVKQKPQVHGSGSHEQAQAGARSLSPVGQVTRESIEREVSPTPPPSGSSASRDMLPQLPSRTGESSADAIPAINQVGKDNKVRPKSSNLPSLFPVMRPQPRSSNNSKPPKRSSTGGKYTSTGSSALSSQHLDTVSGENSGLAAETVTQTGADTPLTRHGQKKAKRVEKLTRKTAKETEEAARTLLALASSPSEGSSQPRALATELQSTTTMVDPRGRKEKSMTNEELKVVGEEERKDAGPIVSLTGRTAELSTELPPSGLSRVENDHAEPERLERILEPRNPRKDLHDRAAEVGVDDAKNPTASTQVVAASAQTLHTEVLESKLTPAQPVDGDSSKVADEVVTPATPHGELTPSQSVNGDSDKAADDITNPSTTNGGLTPPGSTSGDSDKAEDELAESAITNGIQTSSKQLATGSKKNKKKNKKKKKKKNKQKQGSHDAGVTSEVLRNTDTGMNSLHKATQHDRVMVMARACELSTEAAREKRIKDAKRSGPRPEDSDESLLRILDTGSEADRKERIEDAKRYVREDSQENALAATQPHGNPFQTMAERWKKIQQKVREDYEQNEPEEDDTRPKPIVMREFWGRTRLA